MFRCICSLGRISIENAERAKHTEFRAETPNCGDAEFFWNAITSFSSRSLRLRVRQICCLNLSQTAYTPACFAIENRLA
jgi:hypothetical protein